MKIGNAPLPIAERVTPRQPGAARQAPEQGAGEGPAYRVELSEAAGKAAQPAITSAAEALKVAGETREMIAAYNREAADVSQGLDPRKLLDLLG